MTAIAPHHGSRRWLVPVLATALIATVGCTSSASPAPSSPAGSPATGSTAPSLVPSAIPSQSPTPSAAPLATPSANPSPSGVPTVGVAPSGPWKTIAWTNAGAVFPKLVKVPSTAFQIGLFGWSGGYVAFGSDGGPAADPATKPTLVATSSADGLHWSAPKSIDVAGFSDQVDITAVAEGPTGLVAVGYFPPGTCGGPPAIAGLWRSTDGSAWQRIALPAGMAQASVQTVQGGSSGYIATGLLKDGKTPGIWLSQDGTTWKPATLPKPPKGTLMVNDATSIAGGLVVAGAIVGPEGCGGVQAVRPAIWWSADGGDWTLESLPGTSTAADTSLRIVRIDDHTVAAIELAGDATLAWASNDGKAWTKLDHPAEAALYWTTSAKDRAIAITNPDSGPLLIQEVGADLGLTTLAQSGSGPTISDSSDPTIQAVGPTGLVSIVYNGSNLWLGVPGS